MKKTILALIILCLFFIPFTANYTSAARDNSSNPGVKFEDLTYAEILAKAQNENKFVLVEFFSPT